MLFTASESAYICGKCAARSGARWWSTRHSRPVAPGTALRRATKRYLASNATDTTEESKESKPIEPESPVEQPEEKQSEKYDVFLGLDGRSFHHTRAELGVTRLGKPADIIIVDEDSVPKRIYWNPVPQDQENTETRKEDLGDVVQEVDKKLTPAETNANIDSVRKQVGEFGAQIPPETRSEMLDNLVKGFSRTQLHHYITSTIQKQKAAQKESDNKDEVDIEETDEDGKAPANDLKFPLGPDFVVSKKRYNAILHVVDAAGKQKQSKQRLASVIVGKLWRFRVLGELQKADIELEDWQGELLLKSSSAKLEAVLRRYGVRFEVLPGGKTCRVSGFGEGFEAAKAQIEEFLGEIQHQDHKVIKRPSELPRSGNEIESDVDLENYLNDRYSAIISRKNSKTWTITSYPSNRVMDRVLRDIYLTRKPTPTFHHIGIFAAKGLTNLEKVNGVFDDGIPWIRPRSKHWIRWSGSAAGGDLVPSSTTLKQDFNGRLRLVALQRTLSRLGSIGGVKYEMTATFGQTLLHQNSQSQSDGTDTLQTLQTSRIAYARDYPRLPQVLAGLNHTSRSKIVELVLSPIPTTGKATSKHPDLHMILSSGEKDSEGKPRLIHMDAILNESIFDVLLPRSSVDINFNAQFRYNLLQQEPEFAAKVMESLFLQEKTNVKQLAALCTLTIPQGLLELSKWASALATAWKFGNKAPRHAKSSAADGEIPYMISSSQITESENFTFEGLPLSYRHCMGLQSPMQSKTVQLTSEFEFKSESTTTQEKEMEKAKNSIQVIPDKPSSFLQFAEKAMKFAKRLGQS